MTLSPDEIAFWGAMMYVAGANRTAGNDVETLATINPEQFRQALDLAKHELPKFKQKIKEQRRRRPVS